AGRALQKARNRDADWHESRFTQRSHFESLRRYTTWDGGERARIRADRARPRLSRFRFLDESQQPEGDDRSVSAARCAIKPTWTRSEERRVGKESKCRESA